MFKINIKTPEWCQWRRSSVSLADFGEKKVCWNVVEKIFKKCQNKYLDEVFSGQIINFKLLVEHSMNMQRFL